MAKVVESAHYAEECMDLKGGMRSCIPQQPRFLEKAPRTLSMGEISRPPPYGNRVSPRVVAAGISMAVSATYHGSPTTQASP